MKQKRSADIVPAGLVDRLFGSGFESPPAGTNVGGPLTAEERLRLQAAWNKGLSELKREDSRPGVMFTARSRVASLLQTEIAQTAGATGKMNQLRDGVLEATLDDKDSHYIYDTVAQKILHPRAFSWVPPPVAPEHIFKDKFRVAVFGDWGTGLYGAPLIAKAIESDPDPFELIVHLGDTYYSGAESEIEDRLLAHWPKRPGALNRTLNGNHEMYCGGVYYADALPKLGQTSSCFWFESEHYVLVGLDTSYTAHHSPSKFDLNQSQIDWLLKIITRAGDRRIVLFSHHYLFSAFESSATLFRDQWREKMAQDQIFAWYWGHEHRCAIYDWSDTWKLHGRCIGHGGFPYFRDIRTPAPRTPTFVSHAAANDAPACSVLDGSNPSVLDYEREYGPHGYATLEIEGATISEHIYDMYGGKPLWSKQHTPR